MSNEGNPNDEPTWEPVTDPGAEDRAEKIQEKERRLEQKERELEEKERELNKRERQLKDKRDEIQDRRDELGDERERLESREETLDEREGRLEERAAGLEEREKELKRREETIESQKEALEEYGGGGSGFTARPRRVAAVMLGLVGLGTLGSGIGAYLATGVGGVANVIPSQTLGIAAAAVLIVVALIEFVGGFFAYRGRHYYTSVFASLIAIALFFPVGLTAMFMLGVGESQFD